MAFAGGQRPDTVPGWCRHGWELADIVKVLEDWAAADVLSARRSASSRRRAASSSERGMSLSNWFKLNLLTAAFRDMEWRRTNRKVERIKLEIASLRRSPGASEHGNRAVEELDAALCEALYSNEIWFYSLVGRGISIWGGIETAMVAIVSALTGIKSEHAGLLMYSNMNFNLGWRGVVTELLRENSRTEHLVKAQWNDIQKRLGALKDTRDAIAHRSALNSEKLPNGAYELKASEWDIRTKSRKATAIRIDDMEKFVVECADTYRLLRSLHKAIKSALSDHPSPDIST